MLKNRRFNHPSLIVVGSVGWVKRRVSAATGCSAPLSSHFRAGADADRLELAVMESFPWVAI